MATTVAEAHHDEQLSLINAHPDLAGKWNSVASLSAASASEQQDGGLTSITKETYEFFHKGNSEYRKKFGFPFIICVKEHTLDSILNAFTQRLTHDAEAEFTIARGQIDRIAYYRLRARIIP